MDAQWAPPPMPSDTRSDFFAAMSGLQEEFAAATVDIEMREAALKAAFVDVRQVLEDGIGETILAPRTRSRAS